MVPSSGPIRNASSHVTEELALDGDHFNRVGAGAVARGYSPAIAAIAGEPERVAHCILLLYISRPTAVLKIVDAFGAHERVLDAAKINPHMRELVREQRPRVKIFISLATLPPAGRSPTGIAALGT